jgi:hypothetical protein
MRKLLYTVGAFGFLGSVAMALLHFEFKNPTIALIAPEAFKICNCSPWGAADLVSEWRQAAKCS